MGDRPCRGCCASGSRSGQSSERGAQGPSLSDRSLCYSPPRINGLRSSSAARRQSEWAFILASRWPKRKALLPKGVISSRRFCRGPERPLPTGDRLPAILTAGRFGRGRTSRIALLRCHWMHTSLEWRETVSPGSSPLLAQARLLHSTRARFHDGSGLGTRSF